MKTTLEAIREYEQAILASRGKFIRQVQSVQELQFDQLQEMASQLKERLEHYDSIKRLRKQLKQHDRSHPPQTERNFDFTLQVRAQSEIK